MSIISIEQCLSQLQELDLKFSEIEDDRDDFEDDYEHLHEYNRLKYLDFLNRRSDTFFGKHWSKFRIAILELAKQYLELSEEGRERIRDRVSGFNQIRVNGLSLVNEQRWLILAASDRDFLRRLLAVVSLLNLGDNTGFATQFVLADLHYQARKVGIKPDPIFDGISSISSEKIIQPADVSPRKFFASFMDLPEN